ncbi:unnamed protein product [Lactuca saligna]|uniref:Uncharacterized protein n=1 Tax=Lactuca saligna TaxID=75948 RepID=A0AA35VFP5_LACSI|nr:unnamed protein product [Lactuca saligna]
MEDQAEKMEALKKAYAEIILNTAKEAAARTMASECKALRFHHDLRHTKDEALRMLLRFKHMIDSKTTEAEKSSVSQKKRIDELDAQLNETEEAIVNLRAELRNAHERLEEAKNSHIHQSNEPSENNHMDNSETTPPKNNPNINEKLYRNGYTHRIQAIENNVVDEKCISYDDDDDDKSVHEICRKKDEILTENSLRRSIRKRKVRCWDEISSLFKSRCKKYSNNDDVKSDEHSHKSKSLAEMNHISASTIPNASQDEVVGLDSILSGCGNDKNRHLKYTFSRKRKKDLSCNKKSNLKEEASTDNNMVEVEVACQLISLSGAHSL